MNTLSGHLHFVPVSNQGIFYTTLSDHLHFVPVSNQGVFYTTLSQSPAKEFDTALS